MEESFYSSERVGAIFGAACGVGFCVYGIIMRNQYRAVLNLAETSGKIIKSELIADGEDGIPDIEYEYFVSGARYTSRQLVPEDGEYFTSDAMEKYRLNSTVTVYYNPLNPKEAVLSRRQNNFNWIGLLFVGVMMIAFSAFNFFGIKPFFNR